MTDRQTEYASDAELVAATLAGDRKSFDSLVEKYRDQVFRLAYVKVGNAQEAEDLAQDAFVAAYGSLAQLRQRDCFAAWLRRVAENMCNMHLRRNRPHLVSLADDTVPGEDSRQSLEQRLAHAEALRALGELSETNRLTAVLFFVDGVTQREIAEFLDLPLTTVKRRINLARTQLKKEMLDMVTEDLKHEKPTADFGEKVSSKIDITRWYRRFSEYIDVGQNLVSTLAHLAEGDYSEAIRAETRAVQEAIMGGMTMSDAMVQHAPTLATPMALGMVQAGEIGGVLDHSARMIVSWLEMEEARARVDAAYWLRTLAFMLKAGVGVLHAVETMKSVPASEALADLPDALTEQIRKGGFADAFEGYSVFGESTIALIRAGEQCGMLDDAIDLAAAETIRSAYEQAAQTSAPIDNANPTLIEALQSQLEDASPDRRLGGLRALEQVADPDAARPSFITALSDSSAQVRVQAAQGLERHPSGEAVAPLTKALNDEATEVRQHATLALFAADANAAMGAVRLLGWDKSPDVRRAVVAGLARHGGDDAIPLLIEALDDPELLVSGPAVGAIVKLGEAAMKPLLQFTQSRLPDIPNMGWSALCRMDTGAAREVALRALTIPELDSSTRVQLISKLAGVATQDDAPLLVEALAEIPYGKQWEITRAVGRLKVREAVPWLISCLDHPEPSVGWWAADALAKIGDPAGAKAIAAKLQATLDGNTAAKGSELKAVVMKLVAALRELEADQEHAELIGKACSDFVI